MSTPKTSVCIALAGLLAAAMAVAEEIPRLGIPVDEIEVAATNFVVMPNGEGLPEGSGNSIAGARVYEQNCLACHGLNGKDGINDVLVGGHGTIKGPVPNKTVGSYWPYATTLFDYIRRAMPYPTPGSLSNDELYAVTAYVLYLNKIVEESDLMDTKTLPAVRMPNRDNFVWAYEPK